MDIGIVSNRYARALLKYAIEHQEENKVYNDMNAILNVYLHYSKLHEIIANPALTSTQKKSLLLTVAGKDACSSTIKFIDLVVKRKRTDLMQFISHSYLSLFRSYKKITECSITLPISTIPDELKEKIQKWVKQQIGQDVNLQIKADETIGGGFILEYDTYRIDTSLTTQLKRVKTFLSNQGGRTK